MKTFFTILFSFVFINLSFSQAVGGRGNGQSSPSETKASEVNAGGFSGDVSLFTGTYNTNYALGTVSTPSGISFTANMSYSSTFSSGDNPPHVSGVPYGEGWNVDIPSISVKTEDFNKYTVQDLVEIHAKLPSVYPDADPTPLFNVDENGNPDCEDAQREGEIFWFSPNVSIPGVFSGRMVFKYKDGQDFVFVPAKFERYVEARYRPDLDNSWEIILDDGTIYEMRPAVYSYRNAPNQRIQNSCINDAGEYNGYAEAVYEPKLEVLSWYCEKIHNPNLVGFIRFKYKAFGEFNYFQEFDRLWMRNARTNFYSNTKLPFFEVSKDLILEYVEAAGAERLIFDYANIQSPANSNILDPLDSNVEQVDGMYARKVVYSTGVGGDVPNDKPFNHIDNQWKRYYHAKSDKLNPSQTGVNMASPTNPYLVDIPGPNPKAHYIRDNVEQNGFAPFSHGYLESPRLNGSDLIVAGDIYEIRSRVSKPNGGGALIDINLASGDFSNEYYETFDNGYNGIMEKSVSSCYEKARKQSIFSTFNQGVKWGSISVGNDPFTTSNFFLMPNIPPSHEGFNIQIGGANSDQNFSTPPSDIYSQGNGGNGLRTLGTYYNDNEELNDNNYNVCGDPFVLKSGENIPNNFGIGWPWHNLFGLYQFGYSTFPAKWWNHPQSTLVHPNEPTALDEDVALTEIQLIRYSKIPYMLQSVKKQVWGPGESVAQSNEGAWQDVSNHTFGYDFKEVDKGAAFVETTPNGTSNGLQSCFTTPTGTRYVVVLSSINQLPVDGGNDTPLTTTLEYEIIGESIPAGGDIGFSNGLNTGFVLLNGITNPLGKKTRITYSPLNLDVNASQFCLPIVPWLNGINGNSGSYLLSTYQQRYYPNTSIPCGGGGGDGSVNNPCQDGVTTTAKNYTYQVYFTVSNISIEDREGEKTYSYAFNNPQILSNIPILSDNFARDDRYSTQLGFTHTIVRGPSLGQTSSQLRTEYRHHSDNLLWGKLHEVKSYDASGSLLSESSISYENVMAFEPPMQRIRRNANGNWTDYAEYKEGLGWTDDRPIYNPNSNSPNTYNDMAAYNSAMNTWLIDNVYVNPHVNSPEYLEWLSEKPYLPNVTCYNCDDCDDDCDDSECTIEQNEINECFCEWFYYPSMTSYDVNRCNSFWQYYSDWIADKPDEGEQQVLFHAAYDSPPRFYESRYSNYIQSADPTYLYSFFIKKTGESQTTYDQYCRSGNGSITSNTSYEYYDADYRGLSTSGGYAAMGEYNESGLLWEPSWQLYKKESSSPQAPGISTTEEYFYLWDLVNQETYQKPGAYFEPDPSFEPLWFNWAWRKARNFPIETRVTKQGGGDENIRSTYYVYDVGAEVDYQDRTVTYVENPDGGWPCDDPVPPGNGGEPTTNFCIWSKNAPNDDYCAHPSQLDIWCLCEQPTSPNDPNQNKSAEDDPLNTGNNNNGNAASVFNYLSLIDDVTQAQQNITLNGKVMLKEVIEQVSPYEGGGQQPIAYRGTNGINPAGTGSFLPDFSSPLDVEVLTVQTILARNAYGQVSREMDEKNLITRYDYKPLDILVYPDCQNGMEWYTWLHLNNNIGLPTKVTVGVGLDNALTTTYDYNRNNTISEITDPNGMKLTYDYDGFLRMSAAYRNSAKIQEAEYSNANSGGIVNGGGGGGFISAAHLNFVKTFNFVEGTEGWGTKAYVDPLGRNAGNENYSGNVIVAVEDNVYDIYDRPFLKYKAHGGSPSMDGSIDDCGQAQFLFDTAPRSRVLESSKYGECLGGGHTVSYEHCLVTGGEVIGMLSEAAKNSPGCIDASGTFMMTKTIDEDDKGVIEFTNAAGQKVATITNLGTGGNINAESSGTTFCYDAHGNVKTVSNANEQTSQYTYNYLGQLIQKQVPDAASSNFAYNQSGQVICDTDGVGTRIYDYDAFGRLITQAKTGNDQGMLSAAMDGLPWRPAANRNYWFLDAAFADGSMKIEKEWFYDSHNANAPTHPEVSSIIAFGGITGEKGRLIHAMSYDNAGTPIESKYFSYNGDGFLKWEMSQFNAAGLSGSGDKAIQIKYPAYNLQGSYIAQNVDILGEGTEVDYQHYFVYDSWNRIDEVYTNFADLGTGGYKAVEYDYDDILGVVSKKRYYNSGEIEDEDGEVTGICTNELVDETVYEYDTRERLISSNSKLFNYGLSYDASAINGGDQNWNGNINGITADYLFEQENNAQEKIVLNRPTNFKDGTIYGYKYDGLNRLTDAKAILNILDAENPEPHFGAPSSLGQVYYEYDKIGNIKKLNRGNVYTNDDGVYEFGTTNATYLYNNGNNKLIGVVNQGLKKPGCETTSFGYTYDSKGNLSSDTRRGISGVEYGRANLPYNVGMNATCENPGAMTSQYLYDVNDARVYKDAGAKEYYQRDAAGHELFVFNYNTGKYCWYVYGNERVAKVCDKPEVTEEDPDSRCSLPPTCSDPELFQRQQYALNEDNLLHSPTELTFPTKLYRIKLCNGEAVHLFQSEIANLPGNINIEQQIDIYSADQDFSVWTDSGIQILSLSELMNQRPNRDMILNGFEACSKKCITQFAGCTDQMQTAQSAALNNMLPEIQNLRPYQMGIPTRLLRIRLCDATETYIPLDYWKRLPGNTTILQQIEVTAEDQTFDVSINSENLGSQSLEQVLDLLLVTDSDIRLNRYDNCLNDPDNPEQCDPELPDCPGETAALQYAAMADIEQLFADATVSNINFPTKLYRLRLCYGDEIYVLQQELSAIPATYKYLQEITLNDANDILPLTLTDGGYILQGNIEQLLTQRADWNLYAVQDYEPCGEIEPCHPTGPICEIDEWRQQQNSILQLQTSMPNVKAVNVPLPNFFNLVRFCDGSELYLLDFELEVIEGTFAIIQRIPITSWSATIDIFFNGELITTTFEEFLNIRTMDGEIIIDGSGCDIIVTEVDQSGNFNISLENFKYTPIPNTRHVLVEYEKVVTEDGVEILREEKQREEDIHPCDVVKNDYKILDEGFVDKLTLATRNPTGIIQVDLNPNSVDPALLSSYGLTTADLYYGSDNYQLAVETLIANAIDNWGNGGFVDYHFAVILTRLYGSIKVEFARVHLPESPYISIDIDNVILSYSTDGQNLYSGPSSITGYIKSFPFRKDLVITEQYLSCPIIATYEDDYNLVNHHAGNYYTTVFLEPDMVNISNGEDGGRCEYTVSDTTYVCDPPIVIYNGCDEIVCNPDPKIPLPNHPFDKKECCPEEPGKDDPVIIFDDGKKIELYLQKERRIVKEMEQQAWRRTAGNIAYPNNLHQVRFENGKELTLLDEEVRELDGCGKIIKSTPIPTKDQLFSVTLKLNQSSIRAGTATLSNVLQLRTKSAAMTLETADPTTLDPVKEERRVPFFTFFIQDHLGNSRILYHNKFTDCTDEGTRYVLEHVLDYYPYGKTLREYVLQRERFQTTHHERDAATGLDYRGARFYDSEVGRFLSLDPEAMSFATWSPYTYSLNNPIRYYDSDGKSPKTTDPPSWWEKALAFAGGMSNSVASNATGNFPGTRMNAREVFTNDELASWAEAGQTGGDIVSIGIGMSEMAASLIGLGVEGAVAPASGGASTLAMAPTVALGTHGTVTANAAIQNLFSDDGVVQMNDDMDDMDDLPTTERMDKGGGQNRSRNNQVQNKQFDSLAKKYGLDKNQRTDLHIEIQGMDLDYKGLDNYIKEIFLNID